MAAFIGRWIYLDWTKELKAGCAAKVLAFKPGMRKHEVQYEDGEREWVDLLTEDGERAWTEEVPKKVRKFKDKRVKHLARELGVKVEMSDTLLDTAENLLDMEDRLPNQGVKSQLPKIWENLRIQILRCKSAKDMTAATTKFALQIKDCVLLDDWPNKVDQWKVDAKRVSSDTEVARLVHQLKFNAVDWAQCRALFPRLDDSKPEEQKPSAAATKKAVKNVPATPSISTAATPYIAVECNKVKGNYQPTTHTIICLCSACQGLEPGLEPPAWERHVGSRARAWRKSIKLSDQVGKLSSWLQARRLSDPGLAFHQTSPDHKQQSVEQSKAASSLDAPQVLPKSKVSRLGPDSAAKLREQISRPETGQLSPKTQASVGNSGRKRKALAAAISSSEGEATSEERPHKRSACSTPAQPPVPEVLRESGHAAQQVTASATPEKEEESEEEEGELTCVACDSSEESQDLLQCDGDGCGKVYHAFCLNPQLVEIPEGDWFCPSCAKQAKHGKAGSAKQGHEQTSLVGTDAALDSNLGFFQTIFNDGPTHHPLFADTEPQVKIQGTEPTEELEKVVASEPKASAVPIGESDDDDDDDALMAFMVPGSAYASKAVS